MEEKAIPASEYKSLDWKDIQCRVCKEDVPGWLTIWVNASPFSPIDGFKPCLVIPMQICPFCGAIRVHPTCLNDMTDSIKAAIKREIKH